MKKQDITAFGFINDIWTSSLTAQSLDKDHGKLFFMQSSLHTKAIAGASDDMIQTRGKGCAQGQHQLLLLVLKSNSNQIQILFLVIYTNMHSLICSEKPALCIGKKPNGSTKKRYQGIPNQT